MILLLQVYLGWNVKVARSQKRGVANVSVGGCAQEVGIVIVEERAMPTVRALLQHNVHCAADGALILGLNAGSLHLDFSDELNRYVGIRDAGTEVAGILAINQVGIFRVAATVDGCAVVIQRLHAGCRGQGNQGLVGSSRR